MKRSVTVSEGSIDRSWGWWLSLSVFACSGIVVVGCGDSGQLPGAGGHGGGEGGTPTAGRSGGGAGAGGLAAGLGGWPGTALGGSHGDGGAGGDVAGQGGGPSGGIAGTGGRPLGGENGTAGHGEGGRIEESAGGAAGAVSSAGGLAAGGMVPATAGSDGTAGSGMAGQPMAGAPALGGNTGGLGGAGAVGGAAGMGGSSGASGGAGGSAGMPGQAGANGMGGAAGSCPVGSLTCLPSCVGADGDLDGVDDCLDACPTDPTRSSGPCGVGPSHIDLTWMTVTNIYAEVGRFNFIIDGYLTRIPHSNFYGGGGGLQNTYSPSVPDVTAVSQVLAALGGASKVNMLLTGHSHFDHSFDTATWSFLTEAPIVGSRTTCYQATAQGIPDGRCTEVLGGERIRLAPGLTMRVIRWNHSGDSTNPEQHLPVELSAVPIPDPATGGLHAGVAEAFPNGGGGRAFLFTVDGPDGPYSWFFTNSAGFTDLDQSIVIDGLDYGAPLENLRAAMRDAKLDRVDLWLGAGGDPVAQLVLPIVRPKAYLPMHWDNFYAAFRSRPQPYSDSDLATTLAKQGIDLFVPVQAMDKWRLDRNGVKPVTNSAVKDALNIQ